MKTSDYLLKTINAVKEISTSNDVSNDVKVGLVIGNESADLDSAVCSLLLALYLSNENTLYIPVLSCEREDLTLKSEVLHCLRKWHMDFSNFTFSGNEYRVKLIYILSN